MAIQTTTAVHPEYRKASKRWQINRDVCDGEDAVKAKGRTYLPDDNEEYKNGIPQGRSIKSDGPDPYKYERKYQNYLKRASFMGFSGHTRNGWVGMAFNNDPEIELPSQLAYLEQNLDGAGQSMKQGAKRALTDVIELGRYGFLADAPMSEGGISAAEAEARGLRPHIVGYAAEDILDWEEMEIGGITVLSMVKLRRTFYKRQDEENQMASYIDDVEQEYTVHRLEEINGGYVWTYQRYDESDNPIDEESIPYMTADNKTLDRIEFHFAGAENNKPNVDNAPITPIVDLSLSHYRNSADEEALNHTHAAPMLHINTGPSQTADNFQKSNPDGVRTGEAILTSDGSVEYAQIAADSAISNLIESKELRAEKLGANFAGDGKSKNVTAEAARINAAFTTSTLSVCVDNVSEALEAALGGVAKLLGIDAKPVFKLSTEFYGAEKNWQAFQVLVEAYENGYYTADGFKAEAAEIGFTLDGEFAPNMG